MGGGGTNTLVGSNAANTWNMAGTDAGTQTGDAVPGTVNFFGIQNLTGGSDSFPDYDANTEVFIEV